MKSTWIIHKEKKIFYADYSDFEKDFQNLKAEVAYANSIMVREPKDSLLLLVNVNGTTGTSEITFYLKDAAIQVKAHVRKAAVIGVSGVRLALLRSVSFLSGMEIKPFDNIDTAKDWLVSERE
jgi:hypothetical protein